MAGHEARQRHRPAADDRDRYVQQIAGGFVHAVARKHVHAGDSRRHALLPALIAGTERARQRRFAAPRGGLSRNARSGIAGAVERADVPGIADRPRGEDGAWSAARAKPARYLGAAAVGGEDGIIVTSGADARVRAGPPGPGSTITRETEADEGVGLGRGRPPHSRPLAWAAKHVLGVFVVVLADVFVQLVVRLPADQPPTGPRLGVSAGVVDGGFIFQRVVIGAGESLGEVQEFRA